MGTHNTESGYSVFMQVQSYAIQYLCKQKLIFFQHFLNVLVAFCLALEISTATMSSLAWHRSRWMQPFLLSRTLFALWKEDILLGWNDVCVSTPSCNHTLLEMITNTGLHEWKSIIFQYVTRVKKRSAARTV